MTLEDLRVFCTVAAEKSFSRAARKLRQALALAPGNAAASGTYGVLEMDLGHMPAAVRLLRRAVDIATDAPDIHSNLLLALGYVDGDPERYYAEHRRWEARHAVPSYAFIRPWDNDRDPERLVPQGVSGQRLQQVLQQHRIAVAARHQRTRALLGQRCDLQHGARQLLLHVEVGRLVLQRLEAADRLAELLEAGQVPAGLQIVAQ